MRIAALLAATAACLLPAITIAEPNAPQRGGSTAALAAPAPSMSRAERLAALAPGASVEVVQLALAARDAAVASGRGAGQRLAVIDYSKPSTAKRMWVFDLATDRLLFAEHVAHGQGTGENYARNFSNREGSHQTSLGLFRTAETYMGGNGYSLRMDGLHPGYNDAARMRAIVMHGAPYVDPQAAQARGRLGRSHGCPAVRSAVAREVIDTLKGGNYVFSYYPDAGFLRSARQLASLPAGGAPLQTAAR